MLLKEILLASGQNNVVKTSNKLFAWGLGTSGQVTTVAYTFSLAQLSAGSSHAIALTSDNRILTWGLNNAGQLGINDTINRSFPVQIGLKGWKRVAAGDSHSVAIRGDGSLFVWGLGTSGQLGYGTAANRSSPVQVSSPSTSWLTVAAGVASTLGITNDSKLYAWGLNNAGQLGDATTINKSSPVPIGTSSWSQISVGASFAGAILSGGQLFTWGLNSSGQLGDGTTTNKNSPAQVGSSLWLKLSMGAGHTVAIRDDSLGYAWGLNNAYQLGDGTTINRNSPVQIDTTLVTSWKSISAGTSFTLGIGADAGTNNKLFAWGLASSYQLGTTVTINRSVPIQITTGSWSLVAAGGLYSVATNDNKFLYHWGSSAGGISGDGTTAIRSSPTLVSFNQTISQSSPIQIGTDSWSTISAGTNFFAGIKSDGLLYTWGINTNGQLGQNNTINRSSPVQLGTNSWNAVSAKGGAAGIDNILAIRNDNTLWGWGVVANGLIPTGLAGNSWKAIASGASHSAAIRADGKLYAWGVNNAGQLGDGTTISKSSPVLVSNAVTVGSWTSVSVGFSHTTGLIGSVLYTWGLNSSGQLGITSTTNRSAPVIVSNPVQVGASWKSVAAGGTLTIALDSTNILNAWGLNSSGQLGKNDTINRSAPVTLASPFDTTSWTTISAGASTAGAVRSSDNLAFLWGNGATGGLGVGDTLSRSNPTALAAQLNPAVTFNFNSISLGLQTGFGITTTGALVAWGTNAGGQLGDGTAIAKSNPVQIGSSSWALVSAEKELGYGGWAVDTNNIVYAWGTLTASLLQDGATVTRSSPVIVANFRPFRVTALSLAATVKVIRDDGGLYSWGVNTTGSLGDNTTVNKSSPILIGATITAVSSPVQIGEATNWSKISLGISSAAAINSVGELYTWASNNQFGTLGDGTTFNRLVPTKVGSSSWSLVSVGNYHTLAITSDNKLFAWGLNTASQLGDDTAINKSSPIQIGLSYGGAAINSWVSASAGNSYSLAIDSNYNFYGWGLNNAGQIGVVTEAYSWKQISSGSDFALGIRQDDTLWAWGTNTTGQLGLNVVTARSSPTQVGGSWSQISATISTVGVAAGIKTDGTLYLWGNNQFFALGTGDSISRSSPTQLGSSSWTQVSVGWYHTLAIDSQGRLFGWGQGAALFSSTAPFSWTVVSENTSHVVAVRSDGLLFAWGLNSSGQIGNNSTITQSSPVQIGTSSWLTASAGTDHTLGITNDYRLFAWGGNAGYQLGDNTTLSRSSPVLISSSSWAQVAAGNSHSMALKSDNTLWAWGLGLSGQLGTLTEAKSWTEISAGNSTSLAVSDQGRLYGWGLNTGYQIGDGSSVTKSSPVQVAGTLSWSKVSSGANHTLGITNNGALYGWGTATTGATGNYFPLYSWTMTTGTNNENIIALRSDGTLWVLGGNTNGTLGLGDTVKRSNFVQVGSSSYIYVNSGLYNTFAITTDYKLFGWGDNIYGQLGDNTTISKSSPIQIGVGSSWIAATAGSFHSLLLRSDYTLWSAGQNNNGQLGLGDIIDRSSFTQVGTESYTVISGGYLHSAGIRADSTLWTWGFNSAGQLGISGNISRSSPTQVTVPGTGPWLEVSAADGYTLGISGLGLGTPYSVYAWGGNSDGQTGLNVSTGQNQTPVLTKAGAAGASFTQVSTSKDVGNNFSMALSSNGKVWMWGYGAGGELGSGTAGSRSSPVLVTGTTSWTQIPKGVGGRLVNAIATDNTLYHWGISITYFPTETATSPSSPVQIGNNSIFNAFDYPAFTVNSEPGQGSWTSVSAGNSFSLGIKNNLAYGWGQNSLGQTGTNTTSTPVYSPIQIGTSSWSVVSSSETGNFAGGITTDNRLFMWGDGPVQNAIYYNTSDYSWLQISNGTTHVVGIKSDGSLWTWGGNAFGELGQGDAVTRSVPTQVGTSSWLVVSAGTTSSFAIKIDGTLWAWGRGFNGQLGDNTTINKSSPVQIGTSSWAQVAAGGGYNTYGILSNGELYSWGSNSIGQLGLNDTINRSSPTIITSVSPWLSVASGGRIFGAIRSDYTLWMAGENTVGALGNNSGILINRSTPTQVGTLSWKQVTVIGEWAGGNATIAIRIDNTLWGWGSGPLNGQGLNIQLSSPVQIGTSQWTQVVSGGIGALAFDANKRLFVWGQAFNNSLGLNDAGISRSSPTLLPAPSGLSWSMISSASNNSTQNDALNGWYFVVNKAVASDGNLYMWGSNRSYQITSNPIPPADISSPVVLTGSWAPSQVLYSNTFLLPALPQYTSSPVQIGNSSWTQLSVGGSHSLAVRADSTLWGWGINTVSQLGFSDTITRSSPTQIGTSSWSQVSAGVDHSMAIKSDGTLWGWGNNFFGQVGLTQDANSWTQVVTRGDSTIAVRYDNTLWTWGRNDFGQLGLGDTINRSSPVQVGTDSWTFVTCNVLHTAAIRSDGTLWTWGRNDLGQLGDGTVISKSSPVQVAGGGSWTQVACCNLFTVALKTDGLAFSFGWNQQGNLGTNNTTNYSVPTAVSGGISFAQIYTNQGLLSLNSWGQTFGLTPAGILYTWGIDNNNIGSNTGVRSAPTLLPSPWNTTTWSKLFVGEWNVFALRTDGALYAWGGVRLQMLGNGLAGSGSITSPIAIDAGNSYIAVGVGYADAGTTFAIRSNGALYTTGWNNSGTQWTLPTATVTSTLTLLDAGPGWTDVKINTINGVIASKGSIPYTWGAQTSGSLGQGWNVNYSSPIQLGSLANINTVSPVQIASGSWSQVNAGNQYTLARDINNILYAWGQDSSGQLGF